MTNKAGLRHSTRSTSDTPTAGCGAAPLSRRTAFGLPMLLGVGAAPAMAEATPPVTAAPDLDRDLLALCSRYLSQDRRWKLLMQAGLRADETEDLELRAWLDDRMQSYASYLDGLLGHLSYIPARTLAGMRAKAAVGLSRIQHQADDSPSGDEAVYWSICKDLLAVET